MHRLYQFGQVNLAIPMAGGMAGRGWRPLRPRAGSVGSATRLPGWLGVRAAQALNLSRLYSVCALRIVFYQIKRTTLS